MRYLQTLDLVMLYMLPSTVADLKEDGPETLKVSEGSRISRGRDRGVGLQGGAATYYLTKFFPRTTWEVF